LDGEIERERAARDLPADELADIAFQRIETGGKAQADIEASAIDRLDLAGEGRAGHRAGGAGVAGHAGQGLAHSLAGAGSPASSASSAWRAASASASAWAAASAAMRRYCATLS